MTFRSSRGERWEENCRQGEEPEPDVIQKSRASMRNPAQLSAVWGGRAGRKAQDQQEPAHGGYTSHFILQQVKSIDGAGVRIPCQQMTLAGDFEGGSDKDPS